jgi:hypothetical protein
MIEATVLPPSIPLKTLLAAEIWGGDLEFGCWVAGNETLFPELVAIQGRVSFLHFVIWSTVMMKGHKERVIACGLGRWSKRHGCGGWPMDEA